jgi:hypothetical protein
VHGHLSEATGPLRERDERRIDLLRSNGKRQREKEG